MAVIAMKTRESCIFLNKIISNNLVILHVMGQCIWYLYWNYGVGYRYHGNTNIIKIYQFYNIFFKCDMVCEEFIIDFRICKISNYLNNIKNINVKLKKMRQTFCKFKGMCRHAYWCIDWTNFIICLQPGPQNNGRSYCFRKKRHNEMEAQQEK